MKTLWFIFFFMLGIYGFGQYSPETTLVNTQNNGNRHQDSLISNIRNKHNPKFQSRNDYPPDHFVGFKGVKSLGCCTKTQTFTYQPVDRNNGYQWLNGVAFTNGVNVGTGSCDIPNGAIITSCTITVRNPNITLPADPLTHGQVSVYVAGSTVGATNNFSVIGGGVNINANGVSGMAVSGFGIDVILYGTSSCGNTHSHQMSITVDVQICWEEANVYYQSTAGQQGTYLGNCMVNIDCDATIENVFADNGTLATGGFYSNNINSIYRTFCPDEPGKCVQATIDYMDIENTYDYLTISDGPAQNSPTIWRGAGTLITPQTLEGSWSNTIVSTSTSGCLTFRFKSDAAYSYGGFYITLDCIDCSEAISADSSDCVNSVATCGTVSYSGATTGPGYESTCSGCITSENFSTWYYFEFINSGTLSLTISPTVSTDDYDFALFESSDCGVLGNPVRCSYASNTGNTGMGNGAIDVSETVTGDGWISSLSVSSGDAFFLMVNNWSADANGYDLNFSLTDGAVFMDCIDLPTLPIELIDFYSVCNNDNTRSVIWSTASEINSDHFQLYRSIGNISNFELLNTIPAAMNSVIKQEYIVQDDVLFNDVYYYKLIQYDINGEFKEYHPIASSCPVKQFIIIPNPISSGQSLVVIGLTDIDVLRVYNMLGQEINFSSIQNGIYMVFINDVFITKLIVN